MKKLKYGVTTGAMAHGQVMAPLNQIPIPLWYYPKPSGGSGIGFGEYVSAHTLIPGLCPITTPPPVSGNILVTEPPCDDLDLVNILTPMYDPLGCVLDHSEEDLEGVRVVFTKGTIRNPFFNNNPGTEETPNPCYDPRVIICVHVVIDRCCIEADG